LVEHILERPALRGFFLMLFVKESDNTLLLRYIKTIKPMKSFLIKGICTIGLFLVASAAQAADQVSILPVATSICGNQMIYATGTATYTVGANRYLVVRLDGRIVYAPVGTFPTTWTTAFFNITPGIHSITANIYSDTAHRNSLASAQISQVVNSCGTQTTQAPVSLNVKVSSSKIRRGSQVNVTWNVKASNPTKYPYERVYVCDVKNINCTMALQTTKNNGKAKITISVKPGNYLIRLQALDKNKKPVTRVRTTSGTFKVVASNN